MPTSQVTLHIGLQADLVYLGKTSERGNSLKYIQQVRRAGGAAVEGTFLEDHYQENVATFARALAEEVASSSELQPFDALIVPPTNHPELVQPYADAIRARLHSIPDLTGILDRDADPTKSAALADGFQAVRNNLWLKDSGADLSAVRRLLIIDDVYGQGFTSSAICDIFATAGALTDGVVLACPLVADKF